ncbi:hypothetical protein QFC21_004851 [Naganishia friedmannii]|uniref:Uncharacterized protein n=1 Tax=Naganishia friedmannii TaxID=89922 RepID=A0ACC2VE21_9TREE|nr:hypothetical protein QFC21_004851 [Naganishia friedmannii]
MIQLLNRLPTGYGPRFALPGCYYTRLFDYSIRNIIMSSTITKLTGQDGYIPWTRSVEDAILSAGAMAAIERPAPVRPFKPVSVKDSSPVTPIELQVYQEEFRYYNSWMEKDEKARGIIQKSISAGLRMKLKNSKCLTARAQWDRLAKLHQVDNDDYRADIRTELESITLGEGDDVEKFMEKFETFAETVNLELRESEKCSYFLRSLPPKYRSLKSEWRMNSADINDKATTKTFDALSDLFNVHVTELKREHDKVQLPGVTMFAGKSKANPGSFNSSRICWNCGKKGHTNRDCRAKRVADGMSLKPAKKVWKG